MLVGLWVTTKCNLDCHYCYEGHQKSNRIMSEETADKSIKYICELLSKNNMNKLDIQFHGGEPLLNYNLIKYIVKKVNKLAAERKLVVKYGITTNGVLLDDERINYLLTNIKDNISISIDGAKESHDYYRVFKNGEGSYDKVMLNISKIIENKDLITARMTFNSTTVNNLYTNVIHLLEKGFAKIVSIPDYFDKTWNDTSMAVLLEQMLKLKKYHSTLSNKDKISISLIELNFYKKGICSGGTHNIHILPDGNIYPCSYAVGQQEMILDNIYNSISSFEQNVNELLKLNNLANEDCAGCTNYNCCVCTRCKIVNKTLVGEYHKPSPVICMIENIKYLFLNDKSTS